MIAIILIALAAGCCVGLDVRLDRLGRVDLVVLLYLAPLPLMVAALGWGPLTATIGGIAAAIGLGAISAFPIASPLSSRSRCRPGGSAISPCWDGPRTSGVSQAMAPRRSRRAGMVSGRPHSALDRGLCHTDHDGGPAHAGHATAPPSSACCGGACCGSWARAMRLRRRDRTMDRCAGEDRAGSRRDRRHDDADAQPVARRKNHGDIGTVASALARSEEHGAAADDARGLVGRDRVLFYRRTAGDVGADRQPRP